MWKVLDREMCGRSGGLKTLTAIQAQCKLTPSVPTVAMVQGSTTSCVASVQPMTMNDKTSKTTN